MGTAFDEGFFNHEQEKALRKGEKGELLPDGANGNDEIDLNAV